MNANNNFPKHFNSRWWKYWRSLTTPLATNPIDTQREYVLRVILLIGQIVSYPLIPLYIVGLFAGWFPPALPIAISAVSISLTIGWLLTIKGHWKSARFIPILAAYGVALYVSVAYNTGVVSGLSYALAVFTAAILVRGYVPWLTAAIVGASIVGVEWLRWQGILPPAVRYTDFFAASNATTLFHLLLLIILSYFFVREYQRSYLTAHRQSKLLEAANKKLTAEIEQRIHAETQLQASLAEKELLLREIHHRVKNNLQTIASLLYLQARQTDQPDALDALQNSYDRVQSMALIHQQLYQTTDLGHIDLQKYVDHLLRQLRQSFRSDARVRFHTDIEPINFNLDTIIPIGLILNELISNAMKHAFPNNQPGEIHVTFHRDGDRYALTVFDTGDGLSDAQKTALAEQGVSALANGSLGLQLVQQLTRQLHGTLTVSTEPHTMFTITF